MQRPLLYSSQVTRSQVESAESCPLLQAISALTVDAPARRTDVPEPGLMIRNACSYRDDTDGALSPARQCLRQCRNAGCSWHVGTLWAVRSLACISASSSRGRCAAEEWVGRAQPYGAG